MPEFQSPPAEEHDPVDTHEKRLKRLELQMQAAKKDNYQEEADRIKEEGTLYPKKIEGAHYSNGVIVEKLDLNGQDGSDVDGNQVDK